MLAWVEKDTQIVDTSLSCSGENFWTVPFFHVSYYAPITIAKDKQMSRIVLIDSHLVWISATIATTNCELLLPKPHKANKEE